MNFRIFRVVCMIVYVFDNNQVVNSGMYFALIFYAYFA